MNKGIPKKINPLVNQIFPQEDLKHKYKVKKIIGRGQYGYVAKAMRRQDNQFVAIKKLINIFNSQFQSKRILRQVILLKSCSHPNIVSLIQILLPKNQTLQNFDQIYIVTEYCDSDLQKLFKMQETFLQIDDVKYILYQIACGIKYLHSASIIHRDLTPSNILINGQGMKVKICDLGLARVIEKKQLQQQQQNLENSSDEEFNLKQIKNLTLADKQGEKKELINTYQIIQTQSLPGTPMQETKNNLASFDNSSDSISEKKSNQKSQNNNEQGLDGSGGDIDDLRDSKKSAYEVSKASGKKRGLKRMNSKRQSQSSQFKMAPQKLSESANMTKSKKQSKKNNYSSPITKLTLRVTTRWYRAPQIILLERGYHKPIDIWSLGCLFGQLVKMMKIVCQNSMQRFPLFPGKYCYPVSPATLSNINRKQQKSVNKKHDQLFMIMSTIGKPAQKQIDFLTDQSAKDYIRSMDNIQKKQLRKFFPQMPLQAIQILEKTLKFDPRQRITIDQIIFHPFLDSVRNKQLQKEISPVIMEFQEQENLDIAKIRKLLANQLINLFE